MQQCIKIYQTFIIDHFEPNYLNRLYTGEYRQHDLGDVDI